MVNIDSLINRVAFDPRRIVPAPSEQWVTIWPINEAESTYTLRLLEFVQPQGVMFHARAKDLVATLPGLTRRYKNRYRNHPALKNLKFGAAIAGDYDEASKPGYIDDWAPAFRIAMDLGYTVGQPNREAAQKAHKTGSGDESIAKLKETTKNWPLWHTSYGAIARIDKDLKKPGVQGWGGHSGGSLWEFSDDAGDVQAECPQIYGALSNGEYSSFEIQMDLFDDFCRSIGRAREIGRIHPSIPIYAYFQGYNVRVDVSCIFSEFFPVTQWWTGTKGRCDDAGIISMACMSELFRRNQTIEEFQKEKDLWVKDAKGHPVLDDHGNPYFDQRIGNVTYSKLLPQAHLIHPQARDGLSPLDNAI